MTNRSSNPLIANLICRSIGFRDGEHKEPRVQVGLKNHLGLLNHTSFPAHTIFKVKKRWKKQNETIFRRGLVVVRGWGERGFKFTRARLNHGKVASTYSLVPRLTQKEVGESDKSPLSSSVWMNCPLVRTK